MDDHQAIEIIHVENAAVVNDTTGSVARSTGEDQLGSMTKWEPFSPYRINSTPRNYDEAGPVDARARSHNGVVIHCLRRVRRRLHEQKLCFQARNLSCTIFRIPRTLRGINRKATEPEIVSIGPYHRGKKHLLEFEEHKWLFLERFLHRTSLEEERLIENLAAQEIDARNSYSEPVDMSNVKFVQMMLLDCCFVLELLLCNFCGDGGVIDKGDLLKLIRDLLKLENQVPYVLLESVFRFLDSASLGLETESLGTLALRLFNFNHPKPMALKEDYDNLQYKHLLDLFYRSLSQTIQVHHSHPYYGQSVPSVTQLRPSGITSGSRNGQSVLSVTQLRPSGVTFRSRKTETFLDISFRKRVLEIPSITIDDFTITVLINCLALEQCQENSSKYMTDYVSFMHCLINQPNDVSFLCSDEIMRLVSHDYQDVVDLFDKLGNKIVFNSHDCYLSKDLKELESYYYSNRAKIMRNYFSNPWSAISFFSAILAMFLTMTQTVFTVLGYKFN